MTPERDKNRQNLKKKRDTIRNIRGRPRREGAMNAMNNDVQYYFSTTNLR